MVVNKPSVAFADARGEIIDLIEGEEIHAVTIVTFRSGAIRGNHYHRETRQWNYLISGALRVFTELPSEPRQETVLHAGEVAMVVPNERHAFVALEDSVLAVFSEGPRGESDTFRVEPPLITSAHSSS